MAPAQVPFMGSSDTTFVVRSRAGLEALESDWAILAKSTGLPMLSHAWVLACASTLYREDQLHIISVRIRGVLAGIAPLVSVDRAGITRLELIGGAQIGEPSGLLYDSAEALELLLHAIVDARQPVLLARIPANVPVAARLRSVARGRGLLAALRVIGTVGVPIASDWEEYVARLSSRRRYDLRRARRRAEEVGRVTVRILDPEPDEAAGMLAELVRLEATGWKYRNGSSLQQRDGLRQFYQRYAALGAVSRIIRFSFLDVDDKAVAAQLSVEYADRLWVLKIGYDERWSRCSPGWQLLAETMRHAFGRGLRSYEFLGSDETWLSGWNAEARALSTVAYYPATLPGMYCLAVDAESMARTRLTAWLRRAGTRPRN